jgi:hypothetical protein
MGGEGIVRMIIEFKTADDQMAEDFDTNDIGSESPERIALAFVQLVEMYGGLVADRRNHIEALFAIGLTCTVTDPELFIHDRAKAVEAHTRMLAEFDADHPATAEKS